MKLKRLEIIGFKSFMDRTVLNFDRDITSIVGPNGCGKSNIVDAIRWVMGEQSAKHLRGKLMEDVIFAGTQNRAPLSMASVELTFSTEGFQTPADYLDHSEISVCRCLYRTGESEYFINKVPVRLKDIIDLFLGTGIGTKAYSIIEQGRVGQIVTAKPEERRYYIEEVAGVSKFKSRKEAALRKIEATRQNLLRLTDLVSELERQMRSLDRQAKKAARFKEIRSEYQKRDLAFLSFHYSEDSKKQSRLESELGLCDEKEVAVKAALQVREHEADQQKLELMEQEKTLQDLHNTLFEVSNTAAILENNIQYKRQEAIRLKGEDQQLKINREEMEAKFRGNQNGLAQINEQKLVADLDVGALHDEVASLTAELEWFKETTLLERQRVDELRERIYQDEKNLSQIQSACQSKSQRLDELRLKNEGDEEEFRRMSENSDQLEGGLTSALADLTSLKQLRQDLELQTSELATQFIHQKQSLKEQESGLQNLKDDLTLHQSRLTSLEELQRNFEGYQEGTRNVLRRKKEEGTTSIVGTISDFVETEPAYEEAVSAVLGEKLQYIVVASHAAGMEAVDYLKQASGGRSSFVPMQVRTHATSGEIAPQEGVLGPLKNYVALHKEYDQLAEFLFGDVVLVSDLKKALDVWSANGHQKTLVTMNGEVVDPHGIITGGSSADASKAFLEKKREMKELGASISKLQIVLSEKEGLRGALECEVGQLERALELVKNSSFEEGIRLAHQEKDVNHFQEGLQELEAARKKVALRIAEEKETLAQLEPEITELKEKGSTLEAQIGDAKAIYESVKQALQIKNQEGEDLAARATEKKIQLANGTQRQTHLQSEIDRELEEILRLRLDRVKWAQDQSVLLMRLELLTKDLDHLTKLLDKKLKKKDALEESVRVFRETYEALQKQLDERESELKGLRIKADEASNKASGIAVQLTEVRSKMKHRAEQCLERHQQGLVDIYDQHYDEALDLEATEARILELRGELQRLGDVNTAALVEYEEIKTRFEFLNTQKIDLETSVDSLEKAIHKINRTTRDKFLEAFNLVNERFQAVFPILFQGGRAELRLTDESNLLDTGVEIAAQPPGKKLQSINLLSGGEKALTAVSLIFAIFQIKPSPFCILDEVDAPLDDANVTRYNEMIRMMTHKTQFVVITHNKLTMETADFLYGVTMQENGISQIVSVELSK